MAARRRRSQSGAPGATCAPADVIDCRASGYTVTREICRARRARGERSCSRCPENTNQMFLFGSPRQVGARYASSSGP